MIQFFFGNDTYRSRRALQDVINNLAEEQREVFYYDASQGDDIRLLEQHAKSASLFGPSPAVVLSYPLTLKDSDWEFLEAVLPALHGTETPFLFFEGAPGGKKAKRISTIQKYAKKSAEFPMLINSHLKKYVEAMVLEKNISLTPVVLEELIRNFGGDLWAISNELEKYILTGSFEYEKNISLQEKLYDFTDALSEGDHASAYRLLEGVKASGFEDPYILATLAGVLRNMIRVKAILPTNPDYQKMESLGLHPYVLKKTLSQVRRFRLDDLKRLYRGVLEGDIAVKTSDAESGAVFTKLISQF